MNSRVFESIKYYYEADPTSANFDPSHLDDAIINCDYYVRAGVNRVRFMSDFAKIMETASKITAEDYLHFFSVELAYLIKRYFDKEYFEMRCKEKQDLSSKKKLKDSVKKMDKETLKEFVKFIITERHTHNLFVSNDSSVNMWKDLNDRCVKRDGRVPALSSVEHNLFSKTDPLYHFRFLSKKTIAEVVCNHIDKDIELATKVANKFYKSRATAARECMLFELCNY